MEVHKTRDNGRSTVIKTFNIQQKQKQTTASSRCALVPGSFWFLLPRFGEVTSHYITKRKKRDGKRFGTPSPPLGISKLQQRGNHLQKNKAAPQ